VYCNDGVCDVRKVPRYGDHNREDIPLPNADDLD